MISAKRLQLREGPVGKWKRINTWSIKGPLIFLACVYGGLSAAFNWDAVPLIASIAITLPVLGFRDLWKETKFWITILLLGLAQIPLVIAVRMLLGRPTVPFLFALTICDALLIVAIILWMFPSE